MGHGSCACVWVSWFRARWGGIALLGLGGWAPSPGIGVRAPPLGLGSGLAVVYM